MRPTIVAQNKYKRLGKPHELVDATKNQLATEGGALAEPTDGIFDADISEIAEKPEENAAELRDTIKDSQSKIDDSSI